MARKESTSHVESAVGRRELIVTMRSDADGAPGLESMSTSLHREIKEILKGKTKLVPLFPVEVRDSAPALESLRSHAEMPDFSPPNMAEYLYVDAPDEQLDELAEQLQKLEEVEAAYVKPAAEPAGLNDMAPSGEDVPASTPDFTSRQIYLNAAPAGVDAKYAWQFLGGRGSGVRIIDCEWGWRFNHEDLQSNQGGVVIGTASSDDNHGTAVLGEFSGDRNTFGVVGICSDARVSAASFQNANTATVIAQAANLLSAGDILLLEIHRSGPGASGVGQDGYIAVEWWPDDLAAIRFAVNKGVLVVEAAGNGFRNLDSPVYETRPSGFPVTWKNPFNPGNPTSGAIVVGAGAPPPGTHGRDHGPDRSRLDFSNFGRRIDTQGWGREVTTTGYGDLQGGANRDLWYTDQFSGTSSASPIIVGVLGCLQGMLRANSRPLLTPAQARQHLRATGSPQQDAPNRPRTQRIGNRPNLRQLIPAVFSSGSSPQIIEESTTVTEARSKVTIRVGGVTVTIETEGDAVVE